MVRITLTDEQIRRIQQAHEAVQLCDPKGNVLCTVQYEFTPEFIAELKRRAGSPGPWFTGEQVQTRLQALQKEWDRTGGFDEAYMHEFLGRLEQSDPGHLRADKANP